MDTIAISAPVFLSASIPDVRKLGPHLVPADVIAIREAVCALTQLVLAQDLLVFGGHPAISPFILAVARRIQHVDRVRIFQSELFTEVAPPENLAFQTVIWVPPVERDRQKSLDAMRHKMLTSQRFCAGVFIGGKEGVEEEFELFHQLHPRAHIYPVPTTGAAARWLFTKHRALMPKELRAQLLRDLFYERLFRSLHWT